MPMKEKQLHDDRLLLCVAKLEGKGQKFLSEVTTQEKERLIDSKKKKGKNIKYRGWGCSPMGRVLALHARSLGFHL